MIQKKVIEAIYKKFCNRPNSPDELDIPLLFEKLPEEPSVEIDEHNLILNAFPSHSPFHMIPIRNIHAIVEFDESIAIVMHSSIIFISKETGMPQVHIKEEPEGIFDRLKRNFAGMKKNS